MKNPKDVRLMEQNCALFSYLEDLLREVPETEEEAPQSSETVAEARPLAPVVEVFPCAPAMPASEPEAPPPAAVTARTPQAAAQPEPEPEAVPEEAMWPEWAESRFQCLFFKVAGITLAVPLVKLNGVIPWNDAITPMPGHTPAFLGLLRHLNRNVKVMDTAHVILPDGQRPDSLPPPGERIHKILLMDEGRWGLACDDVAEVVTLSRDDVRWRTAQGKRPWLAGTVSARLCALLDTEVLADMLETGTRD